MDIKKLAGEIVKGVKVALPFLRLFSASTKNTKDDALIQNIGDELATIEGFALQAEVFGQALPDKGITGEEKALATAPMTAQLIRVSYAARGKKLKGGHEAELLRLSGVMSGTVYDISKLFEE